MSSSVPTVHLRFMSGKEVVLQGQTPRHLLRALRADMPTPGQYRGFNFGLHDKDGTEIGTDDNLNDGAEYAVLVLEVDRSEALVEIDDSVDVMMWSCKNFFDEVCDCHMCYIRPPGKFCRNCGLHRFTGNLGKCPSCMRSNRDSAAKRRQKSRETGMCTTCTSPAEDNRVRCRRCREKSNAYYRTKYALKKTK